MYFSFNNNIWYSKLTHAYIRHCNQYANIQISLQGNVLRIYLCFIIPRKGSVGISLTPKNKQWLKVKYSILLYSNFHASFFLSQNFIVSILNFYEWNYPLIEAKNLSSSIVSLPVLSKSETTTSLRLLVGS